MSTSKKLEDVSVIIANFWDHAQNIEHPMLCQVVGKVLDETKLHYSVCCWDLMDSPSDTRKGNWHVFSILKSTIVSKKIIKVRI